MFDTYSSEYRRLLPQTVDRYIKEQCSNMYYGKTDMSEVVRALLIMSFLKEEDYYVSCREAGKNISQSLQRVDRCLAFFDNEAVGIERSVYPSHDGWNELLRDYEDCILVYADNSSDIILHKGRLDSFTAPIVLLSLDEMSDSVYFSDNVVAIKLENTSILKFENSFIRRNFPFIYNRANSISWLLSILKPNKIINLTSGTITGMILDRLYHETKRDWQTN